MNISTIILEILLGLSSIYLRISVREPVILILWRVATIPIIVNKQLPKAEATKLDVNENVPTDLFANK